jgi:hypothetical protein
MIPLLDQLYSKKKEKKDGGKFVFIMVQTIWNTLHAVTVLWVQPEASQSRTSCLSHCRRHGYNQSNRLTIELLPIELQPS